MLVVLMIWIMMVGFVKYQLTLTVNFYLYMTSYIIETEDQIIVNVQFFLKRIENKTNIEKASVVSGINPGKNSLDTLIEKICEDCDINIGKRYIINHSMKTT